MHPCCKNAPLLRKHHKNTPIFTQIDAVSVLKRNDFSDLTQIGTPPRRNSRDMKGVGRGPWGGWGLRIHVQTHRSEI